MRADPGRINALRLAHAFGRPDVDEFLAGISHEQFAEWSAFFALEPTGWQAMRIGIMRLSYLTAQVQSRKRLKERDFDPQPAANVFGGKTESARFEAMSIRQTIRARKAAAKHGKKNQ